VVNSTLISFDELLALDAELFRLSRGMAAVRLRIGEALAALADHGGHHDLGFSSLEAFAAERCERSARWAAETRALARRLRGLPLLRRALRLGTLGWSAVELVARRATPETEQDWLERAQGMTVRALRNLIHGCAEAERAGDADEEEPAHLLTVTVDREEAWSYECARGVALNMGGSLPIDAILEGLLAEGVSTLVERLPSDQAEVLLELEQLQTQIAEERRAHAVWCAEQERWRQEAEELCRSNLPELELALQTLDGPLPETAEALDAELRQLCGDLAQRDLVLGYAAERARRVELWRRLGFASEPHYVRERLGIAISSLKQRRTMAVRSASLPEVATALESGEIGYEAACLISRIATPATVHEWLTRARERTFKHLREEVQAAELFVRFGRGRDQLPPTEATMSEVEGFERKVASGEAFEAVTRPLPDFVSGTQASQISDSRRRSASNRGARSEAAFGRVTFRWHVSADTYRFWRGLERIFQRVRFRLGWNGSFLGFLVENFCRTWLPFLRRQRLTASGREPAYFSVYRRDAFRCASPVCWRRDVTPHHLLFRSAGGGDDEENVTTLCTWCHLWGIHSGRLRASPPASHIHWTIGRNATLEVDGRTRLAS
jgi:hypothetical protein